MSSPKTKVVKILVFNLLKLQKKLFNLWGEKFQKLTSISTKCISSHAFGFVFMFSNLFILCAHFLKAPILIFLLILIRGMLVCIASFVIVLLLHPSLSITFVMLFYSSFSWLLSLGCIQPLNICAKKLLEKKFNPKKFMNFWMA